MTEAPSLPEPEMLKANLERALGLPTLEQPEVATRLWRLYDDYARGYAAKQTPLRLALVGATGAGKSTLLNLLAGQNLSAEGSDRPTTSAATVFAPAAVDVTDLET